MYEGRKNVAGIVISSIGYAAVGAAFMYFFDPVRGRTRQRLVQNRSSRIARQGMRRLERATRDLTNRVQGHLTEALHSFHEEVPSDYTIRERVRTALGRAGARRCEVEVQEGIVCLRGTLPKEDIARAIAAAERVRGVKRVVTEFRADKMELEEPPYCRVSF